MFCLQHFFSPIKRWGFAEAVRKLDLLVVRFFVLNRTILGNLTMDGEIGEVTGTSPGKAMVKLTRSDACGACPIANVCAPDHDGQSLEVLDPIGVCIGQRVVVFIKPSVSVFASVMVFIVPVVFLLGGIVFGDIIADRFFPDVEKSFVVVSSAFAFLGLSFLVHYLLNPFFQRKRMLIPRITEVVTGDVGNSIKN